MIVLFAIVVASAVGPFISWLEAKKIPRLLAALMLYLGLAGSIVLFLSLVIPYFSFEVAQLTQNLPAFLTKLSGALDQAQQGSVAKYFDFINEIQNFLEAFSSFLASNSQSALNLIISLFGGVFSFIAVIILSFYLVVMPQGIPQFIDSVVPEKYEDYVVDLWQRSERKVGRWLQGQLLLALSVGLLVFIGLSLLGVKYALILGVIAMLLELIPVAGPVISAIPGVALAFLDSSSLGLWTLGLYVIIQQVESHIFTPLILGKSIGLNPITVMLALLIGFKLAGILGVILSVPVAVVIVEILNDISKEKQTRRAARAEA
jgi:predicted PurR-regulated permease PerM